MEEGIVPGGGVTFINAIKALEMPLQLISENAGQDGAVALQTDRRLQQEQNNPNIAYEVLSR